MPVTVYVVVIKLAGMSASLRFVLLYPPRVS
jgi:hypothetical protein